MDYSQCHTCLQNDLHRFFCACEGGGVHGKMAELVLLAQVGSMFNL